MSLPQISTGIADQINKLEATLRETEVSIQVYNKQRMECQDKIDALIQQYPELATINVEEEENRLIALKSDLLKESTELINKAKMVINGTG